MITYLNLRDYARAVCNNQLADETTIRAGISRAYYSAFHVCKEAARKFTKESLEETGKEYSHERVYKLLEDNAIDKEYQEALSFLAAQARKIKIFRVKADYNLVNYKGTNKDLLGCISSLNSLINEYQTLST